MKQLSGLQNSSKLTNAAGEVFVDSDLHEYVHLHLKDKSP